MSHQALESKQDLLFHTNCYQSEPYQPADMATAILPDSFARRARIEELLRDAHGSIVLPVTIK